MRRTAPAIPLLAVALLSGALGAARLGHFHRESGGGIHHQHAHLGPHRHHGPGGDAESVLGGPAPAIPHHHDHVRMTHAHAVTPGDGDGPAGEAHGTAGAGPELPRGPHPAGTVVGDETVAASRSHGAAVVDALPRSPGGPARANGSPAPPRDPGDPGTPGGPREAGGDGYHQPPPAPPVPAAPPTLAPVAAVLAAISVRVAPRAASFTFFHEPLRPRPPPA